MRRLIAGLAMAMALAACEADPAGVYVTEGAVPLGGNLYAERTPGGELLVLDGAITPETSYVFQSLVEESEVNGLIITQSSGGDLRAAHQIGRAIRADGINTAVIALCVSACVDVFIAGRSRGVSTEAAFLLHPASNRAAGYSLDRPYWAAMGFGALNDRVYGMAEGTLLQITAEQALAMGLASERL